MSSCCGTGLKCNAPSEAALRWDTILVLSERRLSFSPPAVSIRACTGGPMLDIFGRVLPLPEFESFNGAATN